MEFLHGFMSLFHTGQVDYTTAHVQDQLSLLANKSVNGPYVRPGTSDPWIWGFQQWARDNGELGEGLAVWEDQMKNTHTHTRTHAHARTHTHIHTHTYTHAHEYKWSSVFWGSPPVWSLNFCPSHCFLLIRPGTWGLALPLLIPLSLISRSARSTVGEDFYDSLDDFLNSEEGRHYRSFLRMEEVAGRENLTVTVSERWHFFVPSDFAWGARHSWLHVQHGSVSLHCFYGENLALPLCSSYIHLHFRWYIILPTEAMVQKSLPRLFSTNSILSMMAAFSIYTVLSRTTSPKQWGHHS